MPVNIHQLIAAIRPEVFCDPAVRKDILKQRAAGQELSAPLAYLQLARIAQPRHPVGEDLDRLLDLNPFDCPGFLDPVETHTFTRDAPAESLERLYFWLLDHLNQNPDWTVTKLQDLTTPSAGSDLAHHLGRRETPSQEHLIRQVESLQGLVRQIIHDLERYRQSQAEIERLHQCAHGTREAREEATRELSRQWHDERGRTTRSAMNASTEQDEDEPDRSASAHSGQGRGQEQEFVRWVSARQYQLQQRQKLRLTTLRSQITTLKLTARWLQPYLVPPQNQAAGLATAPAVVSAFNTALIRLVLLVEDHHTVGEGFVSGALPAWLDRPRHRRSVPLLVVELDLRAIPEKPKGKGFVYRGRAQIALTSYALRPDENAMLKNVLHISVLADVLQAIQVLGDENAVVSFIDDVERFMASEGTRPSEGDLDSQDTNPFTELARGLAILMGWRRPQRSKEESNRPCDQDSAPERVLRSRAILAARLNCLRLWEAIGPSSRSPERN